MTLGKRIADNRKRLGLTQDALAEKLGITAQAVSKWENDQSCPDITMLPKLAEIFGTTTDELLGREAPPPVREAEVVDENREPHIHFENGSGSWNFHWDSGRKHAVSMALLILVVGVLTVCSKVLSWDVSFWGILWPTAVMWAGLTGIGKHFSFFNLCCTLLGGYYLVKNLGVWELNVAGELVFPILVVLLGLSMLIDALKKPRKPRFRVTHNGKTVTSGRDKTSSQCTTEDGFFNCSLSFGEKTHCVNLPVLRGGNASVNFGEMTVDLSGCETVSDDCQISANCSFGEVIILVPKRFRTTCSDRTAFANVSVSGHPDADAEGDIYIDANVSFGEVLIKYI